MNIVLMNGGLGNQLSQFIFLRWLETKTVAPCMIDDSAFFGSHVEHNGYELERIFGIRLPRLSERFDAGVWTDMIRRRDEGISIPQQLYDAGGLAVFAYDAENFSYDGNTVSIAAQGVPLVSGGNAYYHVYNLGATDQWAEIGDAVRGELRLPLLSDDTANAYYARRIQAESSAAVHVRRGDFLECGLDSPPEDFVDGIATVERVSSNAVHYYLFSDDLDYCRSHWRALGLENVAGRLTVVEGNRGKNAYIDMQLMSLCKYFITSRSSFSLLAYMLSTVPGKMLIAPIWQRYNV